MEMTLFPDGGFTWLFAFITVYLACQCLFNIYFHPLASFPGPLLARCSLLWRFYHSQAGRFHTAIEAQHRTYGPVFRVSPNELSFSSVASWKDIYGDPGKGKPSLVKSEFYELYGSGFRSSCIGSERDVQRHSQMRKLLSKAFSTKSLGEQEYIVSMVVDNFVNCIASTSQSATKGLDITKWAEMAAYDILSEMAFGESFGSIESGHTHPWSDLIAEHLYFITLADNLHRMPFVPTLFRKFFPSTLAAENKNSQYARAQIARRLERKASRRQDFLTNLVMHVENGELSQEELTAHSSTLVIAGGEAVATVLSSAIVLLLQNQKSYERLTREIRDSFRDYSDITATATQRLIYLQAVLSEVMRIFPPASQGMSRVSPGAHIDGHWVPKGTEVYTSSWTVTHDPKNFPEPTKFRPERWLDSESKDIKGASQPFSLGPRQCLGQNFAYMEMNLLLSRVIWSFDLDLVDRQLDYERQSRMHMMWWKPVALVRFIPRRSIEQRRIERASSTK